MKLTSRVDGLKAIDDLLKQLPANVARRVTGNALRAGARIIRDAAKANVQVMTGDLKKSIKVITGKSDKQGSRIVSVGVFGKESPLAHIVEFGTVAHRIATKKKRILADSSGRFFGKVVNHPGAREKPFLRPAVDTTASQVTKVIAVTIADGIEREAVKLGKRR